MLVIIQFPTRTPSHRLEPTFYGQSAFARFDVKKQLEEVTRLTQYESRKVFRHCQAWHWEHWLCVRQVYFSDNQQ